MLTMVIIDDEYIVVQGIKAIIEKRHIPCQVIGSACDGASGLEVVLREKPDVVITDIRMPVMDGFEVIERASKELPETSFVIISGYAEFDYARRAIGLGVKSYMEKPITIEQVEEVIQRLIESEKKKNSKWHVDYEKVIQSIEMNDSQQLEDETQKVILELRKMSNNRTLFNRECFHFICVVLEEYAQKEHIHDNQLFVTHSQVEELASEEEVIQYVKDITDHIAGKMEAGKVGTESKTVNQLLTYINENYNRDIGLPDLAEEVGMTTAYLSILFKEEVGMSYVKYLTNLRINKAKIFLEKGYKVASVSEMVGYNNYRYFCDIFKKHVGKTPTEYKKTT